MNQIQTPQESLTLQTVQNQLRRLQALFPDMGRTVSNIELITPDYLREFYYLSAEQFIKIVNKHISKNRFFPTISDLHEFDVLEYVKETLRLKGLG